MRLIDSDALMESMKKIYTDTDQRALYSEIWRVVSHAPAIDAVPVVRCKDCKHAFHDCHIVDILEYDVYPMYLTDDWFCANGERRDSDE